LTAFGQLQETILFPAHPRTRAALDRFELVPPPNVRLIDAVGYLDMLRLERHARLILTDSGGVQKEAYFFGVPCVTLRDETEWVETVESGWNALAGADSGRIVAAAKRFARDGSRSGDGETPPPRLFGDGRASEAVADLLDALQ
jgi:UDP-N-acetylglucosamine 2-epimerase